MPDQASYIRTRRANSNGTHVEGTIGSAKVLLDDSTSEDGSEDGISGGVPLHEDSDHTPEQGLRVNEVYARRFEHNKKREELHRREHRIPSFSQR